MEKSSTFNTARPLRFVVPGKNCICSGLLGFESRLPSRRVLSVQAQESDVFRRDLLMVKRLGNIPKVVSDEREVITY